MNVRHGDAQAARLEGDYGFASVADQLRATQAEYELSQKYVDPNKPKTVDVVLSDRGRRYGPFFGHALITQALKTTMRMHDPKKWLDLADDQKEALEMIVHKLGRILNGDPNYDDSWIDIAGYAQLVVDRLHGQPR